MAYVNVTEDGCIRVKPTKMLLVERAENRRFSLMMLTAFVVVYLCATVIGRGDIQVTPAALKNTVSLVFGMLF